jgi:hypothetical protein
MKLFPIPTTIITILSLIAVYVYVSDQCPKFVLYYNTISVATFALSMFEKVHYDHKRYRVTCIVEHTVANVCLSLLMPMVFPIVACAFLTSNYYRRIVGFLHIRDLFYSRAQEYEDMECFTIQQGS